MDDIVIIHRVVYILENENKFSQIEVKWAKDPVLLKKLGIQDLSLEEIKEKFLIKQPNQNDL